jgi:hypothetical protein
MQRAVPVTGQPHPGDDPRGTDATIASYWDRAAELTVPLGQLHVYPEQRVPLGTRMQSASVWHDWSHFEGSRSTHSETIVFGPVSVNVVGGAVGVVVGVAVEVVSPPDPVSGRTTVVPVQAATNGIHPQRQAALLDRDSELIPGGTSSRRASSPQPVPGVDPTYGCATAQRKRDRPVMPSPAEGLRGPALYETAGPRDEPGSESARRGRRSSWRGGPPPPAPRRTRGSRHLYGPEEEHDEEVGLREPSSRPTGWWPAHLDAMRAAWRT